MPSVERGTAASKAADNSAASVRLASFSARRSTAGSGRGDGVNGNVDGEGAITDDGEKDVDDGDAQNDNRGAVGAVSVASRQRRKAPASVPVFVAVASASPSAPAAAAGHRIRRLGGGHGASGGGGGRQPRASRPRLLLDDTTAATATDAPGALPPLPVLEPVLHAVWSGSRLGLRGISAVAAAVADECDLLLSAPPRARSPLSRALLLAAAAAARGVAARLVSAPSAGTGSMTVGGLEQFAVRSTGLWGVRAPRPTLALVSRRNKRFVLNEASLAGAALAWGARAHARAGGADVVLAPLEAMPLYEQLLLLRRTTVLAGMHGSGLINSVFMRSDAPGKAGGAGGGNAGFGASLVQLLPPALAGGDRFFAGPAAAARVHYADVVGGAGAGGAGGAARAEARRHWHFVGDAYGTPAARADLVRRGADCCGTAVYFSFWIQSDMTVDVEKFAALLDKLTPAEEGGGARGKL
jgi:hypothetical protein